jgi:DNA repair protein RadC
MDREQFLVCGLDAKHRIIGINIVSIGSLTLAIVQPSYLEGFPHPLMGNERHLFLTRQQRY